MARPTSSGRRYYLCQFARGRRASVLQVDLEKEVRSAFMTESPEHLSQEIAKYINYCAKDVEVTHAVFPLFREMCPHPVSWAGVMAMGNPLLPVNQGWERYIANAEKKYHELEDRVEEKLVELAGEAESMFENGGWGDDVWLSQMDWTPEVAGKNRGFDVPTQNGVTATRTRKKTAPQSKIIKIEMHPTSRWRKEIGDLKNLNEHVRPHPPRVDLAGTHSNCGTEPSVYVRTFVRFTDITRVCGPNHSSHTTIIRILGFAPSLT